MCNALFQNDLNDLPRFSMISTASSIVSRILTMICAVFIVTTVNTLAQGLAAGPMVGHVDMREANIWVQTREAATVVLKYREKGTQRPWISSSPVTTSRHTAHTAILVADSVEPGRTYEYTIVVNGSTLSFPYPTEFTSQPIWKWRGDDLPSLTMAIGSCLYVNESGYERWDKNGKEAGYGSDYEILTSIHKAKPDVMVWLGDNVYLREADWNSRSGILKRYSHTRALPELQPLLASTSHYATWDDHDFGPNNSNRSFWGKDITLEAHKLFWANPSAGSARMPGIMTSTDLLDVQLILLDDRYYRMPDPGSETGVPTRGPGGSGTGGGMQPMMMGPSAMGGILGMEQMNWLIETLRSSTATFKIIAVGSQFLTTDTTKEAFIHHQRERQMILEQLQRYDIKGVIFITGDIHAAELSKLDRPGTYPLYEFTSSALTAGANTKIAEQKNANRVQGTAYGGHNFGLITVSGKRNQRKLTLQLMDKDGKEVWKRDLSEKELR